MEMPQIQHHTTYDKIKSLRSLPGELYVCIHRLQNYFVPFVFFVREREDPTGHGPIMSDDNIVAHQDLDLLVQALSQSLGPQVKIYAPGQAGPASSMH